MSYSNVNVEKIRHTKRKEQYDESLNEYSRNPKKKTKYRPNEKSVWRESRNAKY